MSMKQIDKDIILALAEYDMNVSMVARVTHYHRNTIAYRTGKIQKECGLNPLKFYDLIKLIEIVKGCAD